MHTESTSVENCDTNAKDSEFDAGKCIPVVDNVFDESTVNKLIVQILSIILKPYVKL